LEYSETNLVYPDRKYKFKTMPKAKIRKIVKEYNDASKMEIWQGVRDNFIFGFLGAVLVVFISTRMDIFVLLGYMCYYSYMGRIVNRPKYVTELGKLIVFPFPSALGAFTGYKLAFLLSMWIH